LFIREPHNGAQASSLHFSLDSLYFGSESAPLAFSLNQTAAAGMFGENLIFLPVRAAPKQKG
jgi:hypothetical protein